MTVALPVFIGRRVSQSVFIKSDAASGRRFEVDPVVSGTYPLVRLINFRLPIPDALYCFTGAGWNVLFYNWKLVWRVTVAVTLVHSPGAALAWGGATERFGFKHHQAFGGKADHLPQDSRTRALLRQRAKSDHVVAYRGSPWVRVAWCNPIPPSIIKVTAIVDTSSAQARLLAIAPAGDLSTAPPSRPGTRSGASGQPVLSIVQRQSTRLSH